VHSDWNYIWLLSEIEPPVVSSSMSVFVEVICRWELTSGFGIKRRTNSHECSVDGGEGHHKGAKQLLRPCVLLFCDLRRCVGRAEMICASFKFPAVRH
jgi:hypothetical protein